MDDWEPPVDHGTATKGRSVGLVLGGIACVVLGIAGVLVWRSKQVEPPMPQPVPDVVLDAGVAIPDAGEVPQLAQTDGETLLRSLAKRASPSPLLEKWLSVEGVLKRIAAAVRLIARGDSPLQMISFIDLGDDLNATEQHGRLYISPRSYARYDAIANVFASIDPAFAGQAYRELRPYFASLYAEIAGPGDTFDALLAKAVHRLASVRVPVEPPQIVEKGAIYGFADPALESMSPAEKHILRMGHKNAKLFQEFLRKFSESAGLTAVNAP